MAEVAAREAVDRVIAVMRERLSEPLELLDMAQAAQFSVFHLSRVFREVKGVPPGRFLTAVRLQEAQRLLLTTTLSVGDISALVGYSSLGTFTSRFTDRVGVSPGRFRRIVRRGPRHWFSPDCSAPAPICGSVTGTAHISHGVRTGPIFIGIHGEPTPEGRPVCGLVLPRPGTWRLDRIPGRWYVLALAWQLCDDNPIAAITNHPPPVVDLQGPVDMPRYGSLHVDLNLLQSCPTERPVVIRLPDAPLPRSEVSESPPQPPAARKSPRPRRGRR